MRSRLKSAVRIMAAIKEFGDEISDQFLVCKICFETYRNPKSLSCLHTFCAACLEQYLKAELARTPYRYVAYARGITCPVCRKRTELPSGGVRHLQDNFLVSNLTEVVNRSKPTKRSTMCDFCLHAGRASKVAQSKCVECNKNMCKKCVEIHQRTRVTIYHTTYPLKAENSVVCKIHEDEPLRFFCQPCETCICVACTFREHYGHDLTSFSDGIGQYADEMEKLTGLCKNKMAAIQTQLDAISRCEANINRVEDHIKTQASNLIVSIRIKQRILLDEIRQFYGSEALELVDNKEELEQIMDNLSSTCDLANFVMKDKDVEFLLLHKEVCDKMRSLVDLDIAQLPDSMFDEIKFVHGGLFFGYLESGQDVKKKEFDVKPDELMPKLIVDHLLVTSSRQETQTGFDDSLVNVGTTMQSSVFSESMSVQTEDPAVSTRGGSTQTREITTKSTWTLTESPLVRSRSQNTDCRETLVTNCSSQTHIDMVDALSECHPVITVSTYGTSNSKPTTETVCCGTEVSTLSSSTTTEDLEIELITKYLDLMDSGEPHSPPYNIPFPVDFLDRCSPTSESVPILNHIINTVHKVDQCTNVPSVTDITNGVDIEVTNVMLKDSSTNTEDHIVDIDTNQLVYTYSDSYEESSPEEGDTSADTSLDSISPVSDEDRFTDRSTLIDKDDLFQIMAGEELVQWDEQSALHDMIVLDRMQGRDTTDCSVNTDNFGTISSEPISANEATLDDDSHSEKGWRLTMSDGFDPIDAYLGDDIVSSTDTSASTTPKRKLSVETGHLSEKLESLFSISKLLAMTKKLERRPSQSTGQVNEVTKQFERQFSGETESSRPSLLQMRLSGSRRTSLNNSTIEDSKSAPPQNMLSFSPDKSAFNLPSPLSTNTLEIASRPSFFSYKAENLERKKSTEKTTVGFRKQLARVRKPDISALLNLSFVTFGERGINEKK